VRVEALIQAIDLRRAYGAFEALRGVDFEVRRGEIVGLLGPNGAGKSTCMKVLTGWLAPTGGRASVCGHDVLSDPLGVRRNVGYLAENAPAYDEMKVVEWLGFAGQIHGLGRAEKARAVQRVTQDCGLDGRLDQRIGTLSRGFRQRVGLAAAMLHQPPVLILDEPTTGLDPNQVIELRSLVRRLGETRTVVLSTHILSEVQALCDRVLILHEGSLVADDSVEAVSLSASGQVLRVALGPGKVQTPADEVAAQLRGLQGVVSVQAESPVDAAARFTLRADTDVREAVYRWAVASGQVLVELSVERRSLEEVFRRLTDPAPPR